MHLLRCSHAIVVGAAVLAAGAASAADAKSHRHVHHAAATAAHAQAVNVIMVERTDKVCWRYYGGPKGGMWPGSCA